MSNLTEPQKMRLIANFLEAHPQLSQPSAPRGKYIFSKDEALAAAKMPGAKKEYSESTLTIKVPMSEGLTLYYYVPREKVCTPKETVKEWVEPQEGRWEQKVIVWDCHPLLKPTPEGEAIEAIVKEATLAEDDGGENV